METKTCTTDGKPFDPTIGPGGQQQNYVVLCEEERAKGFVRPVRQTYVHVGCRPKYPTRELTSDEHERFDQYGYIAFEEYPKDSGENRIGRFWTQAELSSGCGAKTTMGLALAETYAREPGFYGATFCATCGKHYPVGARGEFIWDGTDERVGT